MQTKVIRITDSITDGTSLKEAADILRAGGLVVFPTETVYGLGGNGLSQAAAEKIYEAKGRPSNNPLIIHIHHPAEADKYAFAGDLYNRLAAAFMPGPLTVILPKRDCVPYATTGGLDTVAVRCPDHPVAHALLKVCDFPVAAPSANLSGSPSPTCADHVIADLSGRVDMIIDGGECEIGLESTIVKIDRDEKGEYLTLLRPGAITYDALTCVCERVVIAGAVLEQLKEGERPLSPGMMYKHYAPGGVLTMVKGEAQNVQRVCRQLYTAAKADGKTACILAFDEHLSAYEGMEVLSIGCLADPETVSHKLFAVLRQLDEAGIDLMFSEVLPAEGLGLAIMNRLSRAAGFRTIDADQED